MESHFTCVRLSLHNITHLLMMINPFKSWILFILHRISSDSRMTYPTQPTELDSLIHWFETLLLNNLIF